MTKNPTRTLWVVEYNTPLIVKTQEFNSLFAADNFAEHITTSVTGNVWQATVLKVEQETLAFYTREGEEGEK